MTETGTSNFGFLPISFPSRVTYVSQVLWGSIGWSVGAVLGCALAATEQGGRRTILFVGDGSLQLTVQEIGTVVRRGIPAYIFVLNNDGYEIERRSEYHCGFTLVRADIVNSPRRKCKVQRHSAVRPPAAPAVPGRQA